MKSITLILQILFISTPIFASPLSLEGALSEGRSRSPRLQSAQASQREAGWKKFEALSGFLPQLTVSATHFFTNEFQVATFPLSGSPVTIPFLYPLTSASFDAKLPIFNGFNNIYNYQASSSYEESAQADTDWTQFQVDQDVRLKFYEALAAEKLAAVADQNLRTLEDHISKVRIKRSGGVATRYDVLRVEVQLDEAQSDKISSDDNVIVSRQKLGEVIGLDNDTRSITGALPIPSVSTLKDLVTTTPTQYLAERKDVVSLANKVDAASSKQSAASSYWLPSVSAGYDYTYYNNQDFTLSTPFGSSYYLGVFITWNIFDGGVSIAHHKEAAEETRLAELALRQAQLKFKTDFESWRRMYLYNAKLYEAKVADVDKSQEAVRLADEGYRAGIRTTSEVLDAELDLFKARAGAVKAQLAAAEALINLELTLGRKL